MAIGITQGQSVDPRGIDQGLEEFVKGRGGMSAFIPGKIEKGLATVGGGQMRDALTAAQDTYYSSLKDKDFNNPFSLSESEQAFIDNFNNRGDFRPPMDSNDVVGSQGYDFSPPPPQTTGIQFSGTGQGGSAPVTNEVANAIVPPQWADFNDNLPIGNTELTGPAADLRLNQGVADLASMGITSGSMSGEGGPSSLASMGPNYETDVPVFQEAPVIDYSPDPSLQAFAPNQGMGFLDRIGQLLGIGNNNAQAVQNPTTVVAPSPAPIPAPVTATGDPSLQAFAPSQETMPPGQDIEAAGIPNPPPQAIQQIGDGFGEAGTEMDIPAPPSPTSGSVRMPTQGMSQVSGNPSPGFWQQILNRASGKDPNKPFTGNPPPPSSGSVRMPTQNLGN
jgi:hypothetical protein